jgi:hypothetical protein
MDIAWPAFHQARLLAPTGRKLSLPFLGDGYRVEFFHAVIVHYWIPEVKPFDGNDKVNWIMPCAFTTVLHSHPGVSSTAYPQSWFTALPQSAFFRRVHVMSAVDGFPPREKILGPE